MKKLTKKDIEQIKALYKSFPKKILVRIARSKDGGFVAEVRTFPGCFTQGDTFSELIAMINDCVQEYFEVPRKYRSYMPEYLASVDLAQRLGIMPSIRVLFGVNTHEKIAG